MTQNSALTTLKDLAEKEVDDAALRLGEMRRGCQQAEEQLKMLMDYQHEYRNNLNNDMSQGIGAQRWQNYLNCWREKKQRLQAWQTLQERQNAAALQAENRLDQKKMDEFAQRASQRKHE